MPHARVVVVLLLFVTGPALAGDTEALRAAARVRAALPAPSPAKRLAYEGDLVLDDLWAGEVAYTAQAKKFAGQPVWYVTEVVFIDMGGAELDYKAAYHLAPDLSLQSGSSECRHRGRTVSTLFARKDDHVTLMRTVKAPAGASAVEQLKIPAPRDATYGRAAVLLFLRGLGAVTAADRISYALPWVPLWELTTRPATHAGAESLPEPAREIALTVRGLRASSTDAEAKDWLVDASRGEQTVRLRLDPETKALRRAEGGKGMLSVVPRGEGGERIATDEEKPAKTWQQAFLKFGYGYHMARRGLIEEAFHWPSMYAYETTVAKSWDPKQPVEAFKQAWIQEFLDQSLHRGRPATDRLLSMTLSTGTVKEKTKDRVVFAAHANFGGGVQRTYHLKKVDDLWYLWRIDF